MQHVLPKGFVKVRHYGLLANRQREVKLTLCRRLLLAATVAAQLPGVGPEPQGIERAREHTCPQCGGRHFVRLPLAPAPEKAADRVAADTS